MNHLRLITLAVTLFTLCIISSMSFAPARLAFAQGTDTETATGEPTATLTVTPQPTRDNYLRPLIVVQSYKASVSDITPGREFTLEIKLGNEGKDTATNIVAIFTSGDFFPRETGGVVAVDDLVPGDKQKITQPLTTAFDLWGKTVASLPVTVNYTDPTGAAFSESFTITFPIAWGRIVSYATPTPTPTVTPTAFLRPQLVITSYESDVAQLEPGGQFVLTVNVQNLGQATAKQVTMILGGGGATGDGGSGTSQPPGGVSGGSGDLTNFAPLESSNVQSLGDLPVGGALTADQNLIVNVSTNPGAYPLKISFTYVDNKNTIFTDDQVITLLVYGPPKLEISFYRDPGAFPAGMPNMLPLQLVNLGRKSALLGNMKVTGEGADFSNNVILIGNLDAGGFFPLDATVIPYQVGALDLTITVSYTDDFNQTQQFVQNLTLEVIEAPIEGPGFEGEPGTEGGVEPPTAPESFWQKVVRFFRGLIGLDSGVATPEIPGEMPPPGSEGVPVGPPLKGP